MSYTTPQIKCSCFLANNYSKIVVLLEISKRDMEQVIIGVSNHCFQI